MMQKYRRERKNIVTLFAVIDIWCQIVLFLLFLASLAQKLRDHRAFSRSVEGFAIVPSAWATPLAWLFMGGEGLVALLLGAGLLVGGWPRIAGILLAALLLLLFSGALLSVIARGLPIPCSCFGAHDDHLVSPLDLVRNIGLLVCSALALVPAFISPSLIHSPVSVSLLTALGAATFVSIWTHLDVITTVLGQQAQS
jgi:methylamine utilization protein MauE